MPMPLITLSSQVFGMRLPSSVSGSLFFVALLLMLESAHAQCSTGFINVGSFCFKQFDPDSDWLNATKICQRNNATMPKLHDSQEMIALNTFLKFNNTQDHDDFWCGITNVNSSPKTFYHADTGDTADCSIFDGTCVNTTDDAACKFKTDGTLGNTGKCTKEEITHGRHVVCQQGASTATSLPCVKIATNISVAREHYVGHSYSKSCTQRFSSVNSRDKQTYSSVFDLLPSAYVYTVPVPGYTIPIYHMKNTYYNPAFDMTVIGDERKSEVELKDPAHYKVVGIIGYGLQKSATYAGPFDAWLGSWSSYPEEEFITTSSTMTMSMTPSCGRTYEKKTGTIFLPTQYANGYCTFGNATTTTSTTTTTTTSTTTATTPTSTTTSTSTSSPSTSSATTSTTSSTTSTTTTTILTTSSTPTTTSTASSTPTTASTSTSTPSPSTSTVSTTSSTPSTTPTSVSSSTSVTSLETTTPTSSTVSSLSMSTSSSSASPSSSTATSTTAPSTSSPSTSSTATSTSTSTTSSSANSKTSTTSTLSPSTSSTTATSTTSPTTSSTTSMSPTTTTSSSASSTTPSTLTPSTTSTSSPSSTSSSPSSTATAPTTVTPTVSATLNVSATSPTSAPSSTSGSSPVTTAPTPSTMSSPSTGASVSSAAVSSPSTATSTTLTISPSASISTTTSTVIVSSPTSVPPSTASSSAISSSISVTTSPSSKTVVTSPNAVPTSVTSPTPVPSTGGIALPSSTASPSTVTPISSSSGQVASSSLNAPLTAAPVTSTTPIWSSSSSTTLAVSTLTSASLSPSLPLSTTAPVALTSVFNPPTSSSLSPMAVGQTPTSSPAPVITTNPISSLSVTFTPSPASSSAPASSSNTVTVLISSKVNTVSQSSSAPPAVTPTPNLIFISSSSTSSILPRTSASTASVPIASSTAPPSSSISLVSKTVSASSSTPSPITKTSVDASTIAPAASSFSIASSNVIATPIIPSVGNPSGNSITSATMPPAPEQPAVYATTPSSVAPASASTTISIGITPTASNAPSISTFVPAISTAASAISVSSRSASSSAIQSPAALPTQEVQAAPMLAETTIKTPDLSTSQPQPNMISTAATGSSALIPSPAISSTRSQSVTTSTLPVVIPKNSKEFLNATGIQLSGDVTSNLAQVQSALQYILADLSPDMKALLGMQWDTTVIKCHYDQESCESHENFRSDFTAAYGNCFTFNHDVSRPRTAYAAGAQHGLQLTLETSQEDYVCSSPSVGFRFSLQDLPEDPFPSTYGFYVRPGVKTSIVIGRQVFRRINNCIDQPDRAQYFYNGSYREEGCLRSCFQQFALEACGCADPRFGKPLSTRYCRLADMPCLESLQSCDNDEVLDCNCQPACTEILYSTSITTSDIYVPRGGGYIKDVCRLSKNKTACDGNSVKNNIAMIDIFYNSMVQFQLQEAEAFSFSDCVASSINIISLAYNFGAMAAVELIVAILILLVPEFHRLHGAVDAGRGRRY